MSPLHNVTILKVYVIIITVNYLNFNLRNFLQWMALNKHYP